MPGSETISESGRHANVEERRRPVKTYHAGMSDAEWVAIPNTAVNGTRRDTDARTDTRSPTRMLVKEFQRRQEFEPTPRRIIEKLVHKNVAKDEVTQALVESIQIEAKTDLSLGELYSTPLPHLLEIVVASGALTAETIETVLHATQFDLDDQT
jgi:hypothetical protein